MYRLIIVSLFVSVFAACENPLRLAVAGLTHGHVQGFLSGAKSRADVQIVGISDPDPALRRKYAEHFSLPESIFFADTGEMLDRVKPEALAIFTSTLEHPAAVEAAAARHIPAMMEKPLAVSMEHARRIERAARESGVPVLVNYETTWYRSHGEMYRLMHDQKAGGEIRKMVAMDGHQGPREINVQPEFFAWLTDPEQNGAGALFDFGCYGANLMTWMMDNRRPTAVTAFVNTDKPQIYPKVDDEATILVQYPKAQGIIQASWNWPFGRKDFELYAEKAQAIAIGGDVLRTRLLGQKEEVSSTPPVLPDEQKDSIAYLNAVVRRRIKPSGLSSLENNLIVTEILCAARESAKTGRAVSLPAR